MPILRPTRLLVSAGLLAAFAAACADLGGMFSGGLQHPAIQYYTRPLTDPVAELNRKIQSGEVRLKFDGSQGYLRALLDALNIPVESQLVVFSKTSLLARLITPQHPRTIFFNDSVVLTWIPGEPFVEFAAEDPRQGVIFYTLNDKPADKPKVNRHSSDCLMCHYSLSSLGVPGMLVRSVLSSDNGTPLSPLADSSTDHRSPFAERWGGWYVTGKSVPEGHRGNVRVRIENQSGSAVMSSASALQSLEGRLDSKAYPTPYSDVVALMVFEHQMHMMNLFTRVAWEARAGRLQADAVNELVDYLLFVDEWPIKERIEGNSGFAGKFSAQGPRDSRGRSLRQFDLERRLMRYPCSYMIYTPAFDGLPDGLKAAVYQRMWRILSGQEQSSKYSTLTSADRQTVVEILRETKPGLPDYFGK
jgi:hypothetical protein